MKTTRETYLFIISKYPNISETFIYDQLETLRKHGFKVLVASNRTPEDSEVHPFMSESNKHTVYLDSQKWLLLLYAQLYCFFYNPKKYTTSILSILLSSYYSSKRRNTLLHFIGASLLAYKLRSNRKQLIIHAHFAYAGLSVAYWLAYLLKCKYSVTVHGSDILMPTDFKTKELLAANRIISISNYNKKHLQTQLPQLEDNRIHVIHLGIDTNKFKADNTIEYNEDFCILNIGRLIPAKGHKYLIRACRILSDQNISYKCHIGGAGPLAKELQSEIIKLELTNTVMLLGHIYHDKVMELYSQADIFVLSSVSEGIPVVIMEALSMAVPVVASDITGIPEIIDDGQNGFLVASKDPLALAESIMQLNSNKEMRQKIAEKGRTTIMNDFHIVTNSLKFAYTIRCV